MKPEKLLAKIDPSEYIAKPGSKIKLKDFDPSYTAGISKKKKQDVTELLQLGIQELAKYQDILYADNNYAILIILQAMDAAGKDGTIKHVMSGVNPQGCQVFSFKGPSAEELDHDYLWRSFKALPERGRIGIFNRSYYEEVLVTRVHPEILNKQQLSPKLKPKGNKIWQQRFEEINNFEKYLVNNGIIPLKFFLNVSKEEQKNRFLQRIERPEKNWKMSANDAKERAFWNDYMKAFEAVFTNTSTEWAPWHIIPADNKWFSRVMVAYFLVQKMRSLDIAYPKVSKAQLAELQRVKEMLETEEINESAGIDIRQYL